MTSGKLIVRKIVKIIATRCHILKQKCIEFDFVWGSAPHSTHPDRLAGFNGLLLGKGEEAGLRGRS